MAGDGTGFVATRQCVPVLSLAKRESVALWQGRSKPAIVLNIIA
jgi:hypothetical protein